jgi:hypothetical protein
LHNYICDECKKALAEPVYTLTTTYNVKTDTGSEEHYHWECLKKYINRA